MSRGIENQVKNVLYQQQDEVEAEEKLEKFKVLSHDFLVCCLHFVSRKYWNHNFYSQFAFFINYFNSQLQHHHVDDARELCSIDIVGEDLSEASGDFHLFTNVAYINAAENNLTVG